MNNNMMILILSNIIGRV